jgi:hypothetical protein
MTPSPSHRTSPAHSEPRGEGWVVFAGIVFLLAGIVNVPYGIAAIGSSHFYSSGAHYVFGELKVRGWFILIVGVLQILVAIGICRWAPWSRWAGIALASVSVIVQLLSLAGSPVLSLTVAAVDVLVIYALVVYGRRGAEPQRA